MAAQGSEEMASLRRECTRLEEELGAARAQAAELALHAEELRQALQQQEAQHRAEIQQLRAEVGRGR